MKKFRFALVALAMIAGVGAYATSQKDANVSQATVDADCPITGTVLCGTAQDPQGFVTQRDHNNQIKPTLNGDPVFYEPQ